MRRILVVPLIALALLAAGCGGDEPNSVPSDSIAVVGEQEISKAQFDRVVAQAQSGYKQQKRSFPKPGSPEYEQLKRQIVQFLVQRAQFEQKADELDVEISDKKIDDRLKQVKQQYFGNNQARYEKGLKDQGLTEAQLRDDIKAQLISEEISKKVTEDVKVTDEEIQKYYSSHKQQYTQPESREVRHILVKSRSRANRIFDQLENGANFAKLARKFSEDPGSKATGGKLTVSKGQTVPPFDQTAFLLGKGRISRPVKTQYGYHIIQPLSGIKPQRVTPLKQVKESIRQQLLQTKRNEAMTKWVEETRKDFEDDMRFQAGYALPQTTTTGTTTATR